MNRKNSLVVKDNALINASYNLDINEQRLILMAIVVAREQKQEITTSDRINIDANKYAEQFSLTRWAAYKALKLTAEHLGDRKFTYTELTAKGNLHKLKTEWVSEVGYVDAEGRVTIIFTPVVVRMITALEKHFTSYKLEQVSSLTSAYAVRLYEIIIAWRSTYKVPEISIGDLRVKLGVEPDIYPRMTDFKKRVLDSAIKQVNLHTDIIVKYEQKKVGRTITAINFSFKQKPSKVADDTEQKVIPVPKEMSDKQRSRFANLLSEDSAFGSKYAKPAMSTFEFSKWINKELTLPERLIQWAKPLSRVGYSSEYSTQPAASAPVKEESQSLPLCEQVPKQSTGSKKESSGKPVSLKELLEEAKNKDK